MRDFSQTHSDNNARMLYFLILLVPLSVYSISLGGGMDVSLASLFSIVLLLLFVPAMIFVKGSTPPLTLLFPLILLYALAAMIGALFVEDRFVTFRGIGGYLKMAIFFVFPIVFLTTRDHVEKCAYAFVIAGMLSAVMGWIELIGYYCFREVIFPPFAGYFHEYLTTKNFGFTAFGGMGAFSIPGFVRMFGFMSPGSNIFGAYMLIPFGLSLYLALKHKNKKLLWLIVLFFGVTIFVSVSRNAILGLAVFILCAYVLPKFMRGRIYGVMFRIFVIVFLFAAMTSFLYVTKDSSVFRSERVRVDKNTVRMTPGFLIERMNPFSSISAQKSSRYFSDHLFIAAEHCFDNAGFGLGLQHFDRFAYENYPVIGYSSHSNFIGFLGNAGIWGFLIQVLIVLVTIRYGIAAYRNRGEDGDNIAVFLTGLYMALVVVGIVRTYYLAEYTFLVMGLIAKLYLINRGQGRSVQT